MPTVENYYTVNNDPSVQSPVESLKKMLGYVRSFLPPMEIDANVQDAIFPFPNFYLSITYGMMARNTVENLRRDAAALQCTAPFDR